jgi:hypothetical protein
MPIYDLFGDTSGLPQTTRSLIPYEIEALSPREVWGAGNSNTSIVCRVAWTTSADWVEDMVGAVQVIVSDTNAAGVLIFAGTVPQLQRFTPEPLGFDDQRVQFCTIVDQTEQGGNQDQVNPNPGAPANLADDFNGWPEVLWVKYRATFEGMPYAVLSDAQLAPIYQGAQASGNGGAVELLRYVIRSRVTYSKEQPLPAAAPNGGFMIVQFPPAGPGKAIGQVGFRMISMADVNYKWVRIPIGWPPPIGYLPPPGAGPVPWPPAFNPLALTPTVQRARDAYINSVNYDYWDAAAPDGYAWPPGTLLYTGYDDSHRYYDAAGNWVCDIVYKFKYKEGGWNKFLNALGTWVYVSSTGTPTGQPVYQSSNFNDLFDFASQSSLSYAWPVGTPTP